MPGKSRLHIALDRLRRRGHAPPRMRLAELAHLALAVEQAAVDAAARASRRSGKPITCRKGCAACCRQVVPVSPPEAWRLADLVNSMPAERQQHVRARFAAVNRLIDKRFSPAAPQLSLASEYFAMRIACPFLENECCSIHADRPTACREHLVTTPAGWCADLNGGAGTVTLPLRVSDCLATVAASALGTAPTYVALSRALDWARENAADGERTWDSRYLLGMFAGQARGANAR